MEASFLLCSLLLFFSFSSSSSSRLPDLSSKDVAVEVISKSDFLIQQACKAARYQEACQSMVSATGTIKDESNVTDVINAAVMAMTKNLKTGFDMLTHIPDDPNNSFRTYTVLMCKDYISMATNRSILLMNKDISKKAWREARARASTILTYENDCASKLTHVNDENSTEVQSTLTFFYLTLIMSTSNVAGLLWARDTYGTDPMMWVEPKTERNQKWDPLVKPLHLDPLFNFADHTPDVTVCKEAGTACFPSVQAAVDAALSNLKKENRFVIKINAGVYEETVRIPFEKTNLMLIGDGIGKTIITNSVNIPELTVYETATFSVLGDGFFATNITFQNTAPDNSLPAVAFHTTSEFSYIENCEFLGYRAALYVHSNRQLYKSCHIEGNVDFIFGNGAAIFQDCTILVRRRLISPETEETNVIAAHGRIDPSQTTGFVFLGCVISGTDDYLKLYNSNPNLHTNYLGRPSEIYSRTVYINCTMEVIIKPEGWAPKDGDFGLNTLYYGEFGNSGPGADTSKRVTWSSQIPEEHLAVYSIENFLQGNDWILTDY